MDTKFTVIIPTRQRCDTLRWALQTCVTQDYENFEIIVSDNCSTDETEEVVRSFNDSRIRYVQTGRHLSMTENFEFALSQASDGYIGMIGDDDGLLPGALRQLDRIMAQHKCQALIWATQSYYWPKFFEPQLANTLNISLYQPDNIRAVSSGNMLRAVGAFRVHYQYLPSLYFGFVHHNAVSAVTERSGNFFHSINPDMYSGVAIATVTDSYHISGRAYTLSGLSKHSNGATIMTGRGTSETAKHYHAENAHRFHEQLVFAPSIPILVAESFLKANDHIHASADLQIDVREVIRKALLEDNIYLNPQLNQEVVEAVRRIATKHNLDDYAEAQIRRAAAWRYPRVVNAVSKSIFHYRPLFECEPYGTQNIYDATLLHDYLLRRYDTLPKKRVATIAARANKARKIANTAGHRLRGQRGS